MIAAELLARAEELLKQHSVTFYSLKRGLSAVEQAWYDERITAIDAWKLDYSALEPLSDHEQLIAILRRKCVEAEGELDTGRLAEIVVPLVGNGVLNIPVLNAEEQP